jgi:hypothetical protein
VASAIVFESLLIGRKCCLPVKMPLVDSLYMLEGVAGKCHFVFLIFGTVLFGLAVRDSKR